MAGSNIALADVGASSDVGFGVQRILILVRVAVWIYVPLYTFFT